MSEDLDEVFQEIRLASEQHREHRKRAKAARFPQDLPQWLAELEKNLAAAKAKLPTEVWNEFNELVTTQIRIARRMIDIGDDIGLKMSVLTLKDNWGRIVHNVDLKVHKDYSAGQSDRASKPRTPGVVEEIIGMLAGRDEKPGKLWDAFIGELDSHRMEPMETMTENDEPQVHYVDDYTGKEGHMTLGRFRTRIREARKQ